MAYLRRASIFIVGGILAGAVLFVLLGVGDGKLLAHTSNPHRDLLELVACLVAGALTAVAVTLWFERAIGRH